MVRLRVLGLLCLALALVPGALAAQRLQFRPNMYFGVRERAPESAVYLGASWFTSLSRGIRHECREQDGLQRWGFVKALADYGQQRFSDDGLLLTTEHVLTGPNRNVLVARINGTHTGKASLSKDEFVSVLISIQTMLGGLEIENAASATTDGKGLRGENTIVRRSSTPSKLTLEVEWPDLDLSSADDERSICSEHTERIRPQKTPPEFSRTHFLAYKDSSKHNLHRTILEKARVSLEKSEQRAKQNAESKFVSLRPKAVPLLGNKIESASPTSVILQRVMKAPFSIVIRLKLDADEDEVAETVNESQLLATKEVEFDTRFEAAFALKKEQKDVIKPMIQTALANTLGSVGYFYGSNILESGEMVLEGSLLSGVPSRSFFPRGFFWDEGFHQLLLAEFEPSVSKEVIESWLGRFDRSSGWVAREQILGQEAIDRVPEKFLAQNSLFANPPTLLLAAERLLDIEFNERLAKLVFETFSKHREWLSRTQRSNAAKGLMAWKGRSEDGQHTLTSGIDDYPRGLPVDFSREAHVDLLSWACWEDRMLARLASRINLPEVAKQLQQSADEKIDLLLKHHWNARLGFFNDIGFIGGSNPDFVPHIGYIGLIPFALGLVPPEEEHMDKLWSILKAINDPKGLRAPGVGIRSLSRADPHFGQGENYWRGAVWININFLCIRALHRYAEQTTSIDSSFSKLASTTAFELEKDVRENILKQYQQDGFLFENYDSITGKGRGTRPFTGWTALVALLARDKPYH